MPVQPVISLEQIVIIVAFLIVLFALMWFVKVTAEALPAAFIRTGGCNISRISAAPQQRLHLIEVDGRTFLVHAGKGHAASFIAVDGEVSSVETPSATPAASSRQTKASSAVRSGAGFKAEKLLCCRHCAARRNNPSLEFGK